MPKPVWGRSRTRWTTAAIAVLALFAWLAAPAARAGDAEVAQSLFKTGKQSFQKGDYADAVKFFDKAFAEDDACIEARWWRAQAQEKSGDKPAALASYREFLTLFEGKTSGAEPNKEEARLKALADKSVASAEVVRRRAAGRRRGHRGGGFQVGAALVFGPGL